VDVAIGEETGDCAPDAECVAPDVQCDPAEGCESTRCGVASPEGAPTPTPEEIDRAYAECEEDKRADECDDTPDAERCLAPDCAVSSDGSIYCPPEDPSTGGGSGSEPGSTPPDEGAGGEDSGGAETNPPAPTE
jgi:hypothetical protein